MVPRSRRTQLGLQVLEDRRLFNADANDFFGLGNHTISIAPDETQFGRQYSNLSSVFDQRFGDDAWRRALKDAVQTWVPHANINIGFVEDDGSPAGVLGPWRGDERFGDIRVFGIELDDSSWARAIDSKARVAGSWAGDLVFNTKADWTSVDQIRVAAIHELGHVLGVEHSDDPSSVMLAENTPLQDELQATDIEAIQEIFGERREDFADSDKRNDSRKRASRIRGMSGSGESGSFDGSQVWLSFGDITTASDRDFYRVDVEDGYAGPISFAVKTTGLSVAELTANLRRRNGTLVGSVDIEATSGWGVVTINAKDLGDRAYLEVLSNQSDLSGIGGYGILIAKPKVIAATSGELDEAVREAFQWHQNRRSGKHGYSLKLEDADGTHWWSFAEEIKGKRERIEAEPKIETAYRTVYSLVSKLNTPDDFDEIEFELPRDLATEAALTIEIHSLERFGLVPKVSVNSESGNELQVTTRFKGYGITQLSVSGFAEREKLVVTVAGESVDDAFRVGRYAFNAELSHQDLDTLTLIDSTLEQDARSSLSSFHIANSQIAKFNIHNSIDHTKPDDASAAVIFQLFDSSLVPVASFVSPVDDLRSMPGVALSAGTYHAKLTLSYVGQSSLRVSSQLSIGLLGDPIGPLAPSIVSGPLLDVPFDGDLAIPEVPTEESPMIVLPEPSVTIPDTIWMEPFNLGDDWYWEVQMPRTLGLIGVDNQASNEPVLSTSSFTDETPVGSLENTAAGISRGFDLLVKSGGFTAGTPSAESSTAESQAMVNDPYASRDQAILDLSDSLAKPLDVNRDQVITASDALMIINFVSRHGNGAAVNQANLVMDANGDGRITSLDALRVINQVKQV